MSRRVKASRTRGVRSPSLFRLGTIRMKSDFADSYAAAASVNGWLIGFHRSEPEVIKKQIEAAQKLGISGFVVDWYGDREPFLDKSYALVQSRAAA